MQAVFKAFESLSCMACIAIERESRISSSAPKHWVRASGKMSIAVVQKRIRTTTCNFRAEITGSLPGSIESQNFSKALPLRFAHIGEWRSYRFQERSSEDATSLAFFHLRQSDS